MMVAYVSAGTSLQGITLNSTLIREKLALPGQRVVFTCETRNSTLLEWQSSDYIGEGGNDIQISTLGGNNVTSLLNPDTYATRVSVTVEDGVTVIVSQLFITASEQFPTSSVTCRIDGQGPRKTLSFNTTATALQEVVLNSTLIHEKLALPGQRVVFICETRNSTLLEWQSADYIGNGGNDIQIPSYGDSNNVTSFFNHDTYATRVNVSVEDGVTVIVSQLFITASEQFPTSSVTCRIDGQGPRQTISFNTTATALQEVTLSSTLIRGNSTFPRQRVVFTCETRNSTLLEWQSNDYIGEGGNDIQISSAGDKNVTRSFFIHDTYATRVSVTVEDGVTVIVSQLFITASEQIPTSSVTCRIDGQGPRKTLSFNTTDEEPPSPELNSTLQGGVSACPGDSHQFECIASYSHNIEWISDEYIGDRIVVTSSSPIGTPLKASGNTDTYAVLDKEEQVNGGLQLTSSLNIVISPSIREQNHTITCLNSDLGTQQSVTFQMAETCDMNLSTPYAGTVDTTVTDSEGASTQGVINLPVIIGCSIFAAIAAVSIIIVIIVVKKLRKSRNGIISLQATEQLHDLSSGAYSGD